MIRLLQTLCLALVPVLLGADLSKQPTLFVVGYAHLDTQWRWEYPQVIREYLPHTMHDNFALFQKYPHYIFNFSGANRYHMMKEYYPADYATVAAYIAKGRWFPAGSSMEESDVNSPSAESIFRQILYGNEFFRREFNVTSAEYMLPDCFGFPASLPSILAHAGIKGFSTQKLTWGSFAPGGGPGSIENTPVGIPFNVGLWIGPDGRSVIAALNPGAYDANITDDLSKSWAARIDTDGKASGLYADYHYYGTGDIGGAPKDASVKLLEAIITQTQAVLPSPDSQRQKSTAPAHPPSGGGTPVLVGDGPVHVVSSTAEQMFLDIKSAEEKRLPRYTGDFELTNHSAGSLTSEAYHKRWNRENELLADAAEKASVAAQWLGARAYPIDRLNEAWRLVMGGQFHDIMAGTATPKAYEYSWNDDVLAMNQFAQVVASATDGIAPGLDTDVKGTPLVVYNPLAMERQDVVEAELTFPDGPPHALRVIGPNGKETPSQICGEDHGRTKILFLAAMPATGYAVFDVRSVDNARPEPALRVSESTLENAHYRVRIDENGDVASIFDKALGKEILSAPARLAFQYEKPSQWPAWNMDWEDQSKPPRAYVQGPAHIRITEKGPVRVAIEITREAEGSRFIQTVRLANGDAGKRIEFANAIDWKVKESALKAVFPLTASNPEATYNWDIGTIKRGNDSPKTFEYPSHQWFDLTDKSGTYGVTVLSDCKTGSDKPADNTLRLTLLYSPGISERGKEYADQATQDWGHHEFLYGLASHAGDWRQAQTDAQALRLNDPLMVFATTKHRGKLGNQLSLLKLSSARIRVLALKRAEMSDEFVVRLVETDGRPQRGVHLRFIGSVTSAREIDAQEQLLGAATVAGGEVVVNFTPYQLHTFAVKLADTRTPVPGRLYEAIPLHYDRSVASAAGKKSNPGFDGAGNALPAEMLPGDILYAGISFHLGRATAANAVVPEGQTIKIPLGDYNRLYLLAASTNGDQETRLRFGDQTVPLRIQDWGGYIGQWDNRTWDGGEYRGVTPGYIKRAPVAWFASHRHNADGTNEPYSYSYLFVNAVDIPANATTVTLPKNDKIRIMAISVANETSETHPARALYDVLERVQH